jgi:uncharacterized integral membrane protein
MARGGSKSLRTLFTLVIGIPAVIVIMALAVVNNQAVTVTLDPFTPQTPFFAVTVPLYAVFFVAMMLGVILGGVATWMRQGRFRKAARQNRREAERWHDEADRLKEQARADHPALPPPRRAA